MGDLEARAERQTAMRGGESVLVETLARGGLAPRLIAVKRGHPGKGLADRGVGITPVAAAGDARVCADGKKSHSTQNHRGIPNPQGWIRKALRSHNHIVVPQFDYRSHRRLFRCRVYEAGPINQ